MQTTPATTLGKFARTFLKLCQDAATQQQQQLHHPLLLQIGHLRAAATCAPSTCYPLLKQQQQQQKQQQSQQQLNFIHTQAAVSNSPHPQHHNNRLLYHQLSSSLSLPMALRPYSKFTAAREQPTLSGCSLVPLCEERAHDLVFNLKDSERAAIKIALDKYDAVLRKKGFEGALAATQWRSRFGRLTKVPALGDVDPTGSFCAFPDDWLKKKAAEKAKDPTSADLWKIFSVNAVPFVVFGFLDNFTMIVAGDYIELVFGSFMCISTMAAAGLGNTISDVLGIGSAFYVERGCMFLGLRPPDLTPIQMEMKSSRRSANLGRIIGITAGCLIGMFPLLFMDKKPAEVKEQLPDNANTTTATMLEELT